MLRRAAVAVTVVAAALAAGAVLPSLARGPGGSAQAGERISEATFLGRIRPDHPSQSLSRAAVAQARAERQRSGALPNPVVAYDRETLRDLSDQGTWTLAWTLPLDGRRGPANDVADAGLRVAENEGAAERAQLRAEARASFADWALAHRRVEIARSLALELENLGRGMSARALRGEESGLAARRIQLATTEVRADVARAEAALTRARHLAAVWIPELPPDAVPDLPALPPPPPDSLPGDTPALTARRQELERARLQQRLAGRFWSAPELRFGWQQVDVEEERTFEGPVWGVSLPLPLFDRRQGDRIGAAGEVAVAQARLDLARARGRASAAATRAAYDGLRTAALDLLRSASEGGRVVQGVTLAYRAGEAGVTDVLESVRGVLGAHEAALEVYAEALESHRNLELAWGRSLTDDAGE